MDHESAIRYYYLYKLYLRLAKRFVKHHLFTWFWGTHFFLQKLNIYNHYFGGFIQDTAVNKILWKPQKLSFSMLSSLLYTHVAKLGKINTRELKQESGKLEESKPLREAEDVWRLSEKMTGRSNFLKYQWLTISDFQSSPSRDPAFLPWPVQSRWCGQAGWNNEWAEKQTVPVSMCWIIAYLDWVRMQLCKYQARSQALRFGAKYIFRR